MQKPTFHDLKIPSFCLEFSFSTSGPAKFNQRTIKHMELCPRICQFLNLRIHVWERVLCLCFSIEWKWIESRDFNPSSGVEHGTWGGWSRCVSNGTAKSFRKRQISWIKRQVNRTGSEGLAASPAKGSCAGWFLAAHAPHEWRSNLAKTELNEFVARWFHVKTCNCALCYTSEPNDASSFSFSKSDWPF